VPETRVEWVVFLVGVVVIAGLVVAIAFGRGHATRTAALNDGRAASTSRAPLST
jgi:hypothetical protein